MATRAPNNAVAGTAISVGVTLTEVNNAVSASALSVTAAAALTMDQKISLNNQNINQYVTAVQDTKIVTTPVDGVATLLNQALTNTYLAGKAVTGGPSAPIPTTAPTVSDTTIDYNQVVTLTAAGGYSVSGGTVVSRQYRWIIGTVSQALFNLGVGSTLQAPASAPPSVDTTLVLEEIGTTAAGLSASNKSAVMTLNAGAAVPFNTSAPTATLSGTTATINAGTWANSPLANSYTYKVYDGGTPAQGGMLITTLASQAVTTQFSTVAAAGKTLVFEVFATNTTGTATIPAYTAALVVPGGIAPAQNAPVGFQFATSYPARTRVYLDYGLLAGTAMSDFWDNNPSATGFQVTMKRAGQPIIGGGANVTFYDLLDADVGYISYDVVNTNGGGPSPVVHSASISVVVAVGGGGGGSVTTDLVGSTKVGVFTAANHTVALSAITPNPAQANDLAIMPRSNNGPVNWAVPTGTWSQIDATRDLLVNAGKRTDLWARTLTASEPASYTNTPVASEIQGCLLYVFRNSDGSACTVVDSGAPTISDLANASPFTIAAPSRNATRIGQKMVVQLWIDCPAGTTFTYDNLPANCTPIVHQDSDGSVNNWQPMASFMIPVTATGAQGTQSIRITSAGGSPVGVIANSFIAG